MKKSPNILRLREEFPILDNSLLYGTFKKIIKGEKKEKEVIRTLNSMREQKEVCG